MISFQLSSTKPYTFTGSLAYKILDRLSYYHGMKESELISKLSKTRRMSFEDDRLHQFEITQGMLFCQDRERIKQKILEEASYKSIRLIRAIEVTEDYQVLKNTIEKFKYITGIRAMEDFIDTKSKYLSLLETCQIQSIGVSSELDELIPQNNTLSTWQKDERSALEINFLYWDYKEVDTLLRELKKTLMDYTQKIDSINASQSLEVELHSTSIELLGL